MHPLTVLIIDDTTDAHDTALLATQMLSRELGVPVAARTAHSGLEAVQQLQAHEQIDLALLDIHLPGRDVDGRLLAALIRELHPDARILPFTADRDPATARDLEALGMEKPALKPIAPKALAARMREMLQCPVVADPPPLQRFLAKQTRQMVQLLEQAATTRLPEVALLARDHLVRAGLTHLLEEARQQLPFTLMIQTGTSEALSSELHSGQIGLLVCTPDGLRTAEQFAVSHHVPLLVYTSIDDAEVALERPWSVVVGPTSTEELVEAMERTLNGERYRNPFVAAVASLSERQYAIIQHLARGASTPLIAAAIGISEDRTRHLISGLYDQLGIAPTRAALLTWASEAPLHLLERRHW